MDATGNGGIVDGNGGGGGGRTRGGGGADARPPRGRASIASPDGCHMDGAPAAQAAVLAVTAGDPAPVIGRASRRAARFLAVYAAAAETATATTTLLDDRRAPAAADALPTAIRRWPPRRPMIGTGGCSPFTR